MTYLKNVFICMTPLQILITKKIIQNQLISPDKITYLVISYEENEKFLYYVDNLKKENYKVFKYKINSKSSLTRMLELRDINSFLKLENLKTKVIENVFIASIDNLTMHFILNSLTFNNLYTFDDGLANLNYNGSYYHTHYNIEYKAVYYLLNIKWDINKIRENSLLHYTIYPSCKNIIDQIKYIPLASSVNNNGKFKPSLKLYLGQTLHEIDPYFKSLNIIKLLSDLEIDYYIKHPRENNLPHNINIYESKKIFEDLYEELTEDYHVEIYTFFSTAAINIANIDKNASINILYDYYIIKKHSNLYKIFSNYNFNYIEFGE